MDDLSPKGNLAGASFCPVKFTQWLCNVFYDFDAIATPVAIITPPAERLRFFRAIFTTKKKLPMEWAITERPKIANVK